MIVIFNLPLVDQRKEILINTSLKINGILFKIIKSSNAHTLTGKIQ